MKTTLVYVVALLAATAHSSLVFMVATEPGNKGITHSWVTDRWVCMLISVLTIQVYQLMRYRS